MRKILIVLGLTVLSAMPSAAEEAQNCVLEVDSQNYAEGACEVDAFDGGLQLTDGDYFAYVYDDGEMAFWNEDPGATHAHTKLGEMTKQDNCWVNDTAKVCYSQR